MNEQLLSAIDDLLDAAENFGLSEHPAVARVKAALNVPEANHASLVALPLTREQVEAVMTEHYPLESLLRENVAAFEQCVSHLERTFADNWLHAGCRISTKEQT